MESAARHAGFFAAHAVYCIHEGETLVPLVGWEKPEGGVQIRRFEAERMDEAVRKGQEWLAQNPECSVRLVLIYDGYMTFPKGKIDALMMEVHDHGFPSGSLSIALPYRHAKKANGFAVHRPKFLSFAGTEPDFQVLGKAFFEGVNSHEQGSVIWSNHLDEGF